ncbi:MAG: ferrous iron transport protein A [Desulfobacterales bacterium]|nr:ferrous iron transport protein A [Desulfobacterales bacterium]
MAILNIRKMEKNQNGVIHAIMADGEMGRRIRDMGLVPGTEIQIKGKAPLNDPVALRVMDFTLTLRNNEADYIEVEVTNE